MSDIALQYIEHLSTTLGPRGSTTDQEKAGHAYVQQILAEQGHSARIESFQSGTSAYLPFLLALAVVLLAEAIFYFSGTTLSTSTGTASNAAMGGLAALALCALATASAILELLARDNPLRWFLSVEPSQNVIAVTPARGEAKRRVAVVAHVDTHRTPFFWRTADSYRVFRVVMTLSLISLGVLNVLYLIGMFAPNAALYPISLVPAGIVLVAWLMSLQAHFSPFTAGANDNASGVGVLLALANKAKHEPLTNTEVWWVATGCEEVGAYGSADFVRRHADALKGGAVLVVDSVGAPGTGPIYLTREGLLKPLAHSAQLLTLADQIAADQPGLGASRCEVQNPYTDASPALEAGLPALAFVGYNRRGWIPHWHNPTDVRANVDADAIDRTERFVWAMLQRLDQ
jgi:hypothetical protein